MPEKKLIEKALEGDQEALAELFVLYKPKLLGVANKILNSDAEAEDAVDRTYENAINALGRFRDKGKGFYPWLLVIVKYASLSIKRKHRGARSDEDSLTAKPAGDPSIRRNEPSWEERDGLAVYAIEEEERTERERKARANAIRIAEHRGTFLGRAQWFISQWPDGRLRERGRRIAEDPRAAELLDVLTKAGARVSQENFLCIVSQCAKCAEPWREPFTPEDARGAVKVLEYMARHFADASDGSGLEAMPGNIEMHAPHAPACRSAKGNQDRNSQIRPHYPPGGDFPGYVPPEGPEEGTRSRDRDNLP